MRLLQTAPASEETRAPAHYKTDKEKLTSPRKHPAAGTGQKKRNRELARKEASPASRRPQQTEEKEQTSQPLLIGAMEEISQQKPHVLREHSSYSRSRAFSAFWSEDNSIPVWHRHIWDMLHTVDNEPETGTLSEEAHGLPSWTARDGLRMRYPEKGGETRTPQSTHALSRPPALSVSPGLPAISGRHGKSEEAFSPMHPNRDRISQPVFDSVSAREASVPFPSVRNKSESALPVPIRQRKENRPSVQPEISLLRASAAPGARLKKAADAKINRPEDGGHVTREVENPVINTKTAPKTARSAPDFPALTDTIFTLRHPAQSVLLSPQALAQGEGLRHTGNPQRPPVTDEGAHAAGKGVAIQFTGGHAAISLMYQPIVMASQAFAPITTFRHTGSPQRPPVADKIAHGTGKGGDIPLTGGQTAIFLRHHLRQDTFPHLERLSGKRLPYLSGKQDLRGISIPAAPPVDHSGGNLEQPRPAGKPPAYWSDIMPAPLFSGHGVMSASYYTPTPGKEIRQAQGAAGFHLPGASIVYRRDAPRQLAGQPAVPPSISDDIEFIKKTVKQPSTAVQIREPNTAVNLPGSADNTILPDAVRNLDQQVNDIADKVYSALERRLRSERMRRGLF